jgi:hypothetical protein
MAGFAPSSRGLLLTATAGWIDAVGSYHPEHRVTFSLPSVLGARGVEGVLTPRLDPQEQEALARSIATLQQARAGAQGSTDGPGKAAEQPPAEAVANPA